MEHTHFHTKMIIFNIIYQLKHGLSKALVEQWVHPFSIRLILVRREFVPLIINTIYFYS